MVQESTLPATVQAAEALAGNHPTSSWLTPQSAQRSRLQHAASSTMTAETHSEDDKTTQLKKKKNREAAQRCRLRKKERYEELKKEKLDLTSKETTMKYKVSQLKKLKDELTRQLHNHSLTSNCKLKSTKCGRGLPVGAVTIDPAMTRGLLGGSNLPSVDSLLPSAHVGVSQRNSAHVTATATTLATPTTAVCDAPSATYFHTLQRSPVMADNHSGANIHEDMPQTLPISEDSLPDFSVLMKNEKSADVMSSDESNMDDGEVHQSTAGRLVVQSNQVLNNQSMAGLCDNIMNTPCIQQLNTNSMASLNHNTRVNSGSRFENLTSRSMGGLCDITQVITVSHFENNTRETGLMDIKSEQSVQSMEDDTMSDNTNEQANSQTMSEPESWMTQLPNSASVTSLDSFQNIFSVVNPEFEQSKDGITEAFNVLSQGYFPVEHNYNTMPNSSLEHNLS